MHEITTEIAKQVWKLKKQKKGYIDYLQEVLNCGKTDAISAWEQWKTIKPSKTLSSSPVKEKTYPKLKKGQSYHFNPVTRDYVVNLKSAGGLVPIPEDRLKGLMIAYSTEYGQGKTVDQICEEYGYTKAVFDELRKIFKFTHTSETITDQELMEKDEDELVTDLLQQKRMGILQQLATSEWQKTQDDALKWREFQNDKLIPFQHVIANSKLVPLPSLKKGVAKNQDENFVITLSDVHFGLKAERDKLFYGSDYNIETVRAIVDKYLLDIQETLSNRDRKIEQATILVVGDILHGLRGHTEKGTPLVSDVIGEDQFMAARESLTRFVDGISNLFNRVDIHVVKGNHAGMDEYILFDSIQGRFTGRPHVKFHLYKALTASFKIGSSYVILTHGASDKIKAQVPQGKQAREQYFLNMMADEPEKLVGSKGRYVFQGDLHHYERKEYTQFEYIMLPTTVTGCDYSDHKGFNNRAAQKCFVFNNTGLVEEHTYYFE